MRAHYGYLTNGIRGVDGDKLDVFIGPNPNATTAYVVHTKKAPAFKDFDEDKCLLGFDSASTAKKSFIQNYGGDARHFGSMDAIPMDEFKRKVQNAKAKPRKLTASKLERAMEVEADAANGVGIAHYEGTPTFHPPSLKKVKPVPTDDPMEKDDSLLDVTKRKSKATQKMRDRLAKQHNTLGGIPANTGLQHHTGVWLPQVTNQ